MRSEQPARQVTPLTGDMGNTQLSHLQGAALIEGPEKDLTGVDRPDPVVDLVTPHTMALQFFPVRISPAASVQRRRTRVGAHGAGSSAKNCGPLAEGRPACLTSDQASAFEVRRLPPMDLFQNRQRSGSVCQTVTPSLVSGSNR